MRSFVFEPRRNASAWISRLELRRHAQQHDRARARERALAPRRREVDAETLREHPGGHVVEVAARRATSRTSAPFNEKGIRTRTPFLSVSASSQSASSIADALRWSRGAEHVSGYKRALRCPEGLPAARIRYQREQCVAQRVDRVVHDGSGPVAEGSAAGDLLARKAETVAGPPFELMRRVVCVAPAPAGPVAPVSPFAPSVPFVPSFPLVPFAPAAPGSPFAPSLPSVPLAPAAPVSPC